MSLLAVVLSASLLPVLLDREDDEDKMVQEARLKLAENFLILGEPKKGMEIIQQVIAKDPKTVRGWMLAGRAHGMLDQHADAVKSLTRAIELDATNAEAYDQRGSANFKSGKIAESVADFDKYLQLRPKEFEGHWRRGISLYYAGKFDEGRKQFEGYEKVDTNDVENAVWHFLCVARKDGVEQARKSILKIGKDRRVPMMTVYELFQGKVKPDDVLKAVEQGNPEQKEKDFRLFYAHLYLGLYHEVAGDTKLALKHLQTAAGLPRPHPYMWDVARVHRDRLEARKDR
jgi:lipoprotein NlpI